MKSSSKKRKLTIKSEIKSKVKTIKTKTKLGAGRVSSKPVVKPELLKAIMSLGITKSRFAELIGVTASMISKLLYEKKLEMPESLAEKIEKKTKGKIKASSLLKVKKSKRED